MKRIPIVLAVLVAAGACETPRPTVSEYLSVIPEIVTFMEADARGSVSPAPAGPLMVDVRSFRGGGFWVTRQTVHADSVMRVIPQEFTAAEPREALICEEGQLGGCWVREYGVYLRMNLMKRGADEMLAIVTSYATERSFPPQVCERVWRIRFRRTAEGWELRNRERRRAECGGQPVE